MVVSTIPLLREGFAHVSAQFHWFTLSNFVAAAQSVLDQSPRGRQNPQHLPLQSLCRFGLRPCSAPHQSGARHRGSLDTFVSPALYQFVMTYTDDEKEKEAPLG